MSLFERTPSGLFVPAAPAIHVPRKSLAEVRGYHAAMQGRGSLRGYAGVRPPSGGGSQTFGSNWSAATGNDTTALTDGGRFDQLACGSPNAQGAVIAGAGVGWSLTPNVLRAQMNGSDCFMLEKTGAISAASLTHWGRFFWRNDETGQGQSHPTGYNNIHGGDSIQAVPWQRYGDLGASGYHKVAVGTGGGWPTNRFYSPDVLNATWFRYEWEMRYLTATTFQFWPRVSSLAGSLLYTAADFQAESGQTLADYWGLGNSTTLADGASDVELARDFGIGNEGPDGASNTGEYWYYAALAFSETDWPGATIQTSWS